jgi:FMN phosphatase YigB (HAD superfamily)
MKVNSNIIQLIKNINDKAFIVLATDNMDCFLETILKATRNSKSKISKNDETLGNIAKMFDSTLCSSEIGVLKSEDPNEFYGNWLKLNNFSFKDSLLLDDRKDNCKSFKGMGGQAVQYDSSNELTSLYSLQQVEEWINNN